MKCIILAGGFATRLWPLTENKAKPLLHLKDKPLLSHIVEKLPKEIEIIISTNAVFEEDFKEWAKKFPEKKLKIFVEDSMGDSFKKGALGATAMVIKEKKIEEDLMLLAGDNYFGFEMKKMMEAFKNNPLLAVHDIKELEKAKKFGVVIAKNNKVIEFQEKPEHPKSTLVSTACFIFPQKNLKDIVHYAKKKNDDLGGVFEYLIQKGEEIDIFNFDEDWVDIGSYEAYLMANKKLINGKLIKDISTKIEGNSQCIDSVYLAENVLIKNSVIENSVILKNCIIDNCVIRDCIIDENCDLKNIDLSYKMLRQNSKIEK